MDSSWQYSTTHNSVCQVIEQQTLWGQAVCRVWLPDQHAVARIPCSALQPLSTDLQPEIESERIAYIAAAAKVAEVLNKAGGLEKLREKALLKEFEHYVALASSQRKLKVFRLEAVRAGFKKAWQERDYAVIVAVAAKIPNKVLDEDPKLLMWYDQAVTRMGGE